MGQGDEPDDGLAGGGLPDDDVVELARTDEVGSIRGPGEGGDLLW